MLLGMVNTNKSIKVRASAADRTVSVVTYVIVIALWVSKGK